jgi:hypothetical protein
LPPDKASTSGPMSFHPQGTCRIGADPKTTVVNPCGETHDVKRLYVADASLAANFDRLQPVRPGTRWPATSAIASTQRIRPSFSPVCDEGARNTRGFDIGIRRGWNPIPILAGSSEHPLGGLSFVAFAKRCVRRSCASTTSCFSRSQAADGQGCSLDSLQTAGPTAVSGSTPPKGPRRRTHRFLRIAGHTAQLAELEREIAGSEGAGRPLRRSGIRAAQRTHWRPSGCAPVWGRISGGRVRHRDMGSSCFRPEADLPLKFAAP